MNALFNVFVGRAWLLFAVMVLGNAATMPYSGIRHDARLYAAQCLQAYDGRFANDLFFAYGSQAKFSIFPQLIGAVVGNLGVEVPYFVLYLASTWLLLFAVMRLFLRIFGDNPWTVASLLIVGVQPVAVGSIFFLQETFLTARIPAAALTLISLERMLAGRWFRTLGLLGGAFVLHPLVATVGAVMCGFQFVMMAYPLRPRLTVYSPMVLFAAVAVVVALVGPTRCFGHYDPEWQRAVARLLRFPDPREWEATDMVRLAIGMAAGLFATRIATLQTSSRIFIVQIILTAIIGLILALMAGPLEWALLFQGQAFRWVWLLELFRIPCCLVVAKFLLERKLPGDGIAAAVFVLAALGFPFAERFAFLPLTALCIVERILSRTNSRGEDVSFRRVLLFGGMLFIALDVRQVWQLWEWKQAFGWDRTFDLAERTHVWASQLRSVPKLLLLLGFVQLFPIRGRVAVLVLMTTSLGIQSAWFQLCRSEWACETFDVSRADRAFVRDYLKQREGGERPMLYHPGSRPEANWLILNCPMYFDPMQLGGQAFHRGTAMEGRRRALLTRPFEVDMIRESNDPAWMSELSRPAEDNVYETNLQHAPPTFDDFRRLVQDPLSEVIVLPKEYPGWSATNGRVFIYEAAMLRPR